MGHSTSPLGSRPRALAATWAARMGLGLTLTMLACDVVAAASEEIHAATVQHPFSYSITNVAAGVYTFIEDSPAGVVNGNTTLIVGSQRAIVVDSGHFPGLAARVLADIGRLTDKPVAYLLLTHWHMDHHMATADYEAAYPDVVVIAHEFTAEVIGRTAPRYIGEGPRLLRADAEGLRAQLARDVAPDGSAWTKAQRERGDRILGNVGAWTAQFALMRYRGPDLTFRDRMSVDLGDRVVDIMHLGRGNTAGDAIAFVRDAKVVVVGDLLVRPIPYSYGSYLTEWESVLARIAELGPQWIVPGHGPVMDDSRYLGQVRNLLTTVMAEVKRVWSPGMSVAAVRERIDLNTVRDEFCHGDAVLEAGFRASILGAGVDRAVQELAGSFESETFDFDHR